MSLEETLYRRMAGLVRRGRYTNRSEFIRDLIRKEIVEDDWAGNRECLAALTIVYDHHAYKLMERLTELQHDRMSDIVANLHVHLGHHRCAEIIVIRGKGKDVKSMADAIRSQRGVLHAALSVTSAGETLA
jgi:CopG family nickel-responsive transcriptional regulator